MNHQKVTNFFYTSFRVITIILIFIGAMTVGTFAHELVHYHEFEAANLTVDSFCVYGWLTWDENWIKYFTPYTPVGYVYSHQGSPGGGEENAIAIFFVVVLVLLFIASSIMFDWFSLQNSSYKKPKGLNTGE